MDINKVLSKFTNDIKTKCSKPINSIDTNKIKKDYKREALKYLRSGFNFKTDATMPEGELRLVNEENKVMGKIINIGS